jgi:hypothetical protein
LMWKSCWVIFLDGFVLESNPHKTNNYHSANKPTINNTLANYY